MSSPMARKPIATTRLSDAISSVIVQASHQTAGGGLRRKSQSAPAKKGGVVENSARPRSEVSLPSKAGKSHGASKLEIRVLTAIATPSPSAALERRDEKVDGFVIRPSGE